MATDKLLSCTNCGSEFPFSAEEQEFYETKGFQEPKKCKPCRQASKQQRGGGGGYGGGGYGGGREQRQLFDAVCSGCGVDTQVPFRPNGSKPVYCRECFQAQQSAY